MLDRLQAVSSRNMYSEHGFDALIGPVFGHVCQRLIVVSYCRPGSPQYQVPWEISCIISAAWYVGPSPELSVTHRVVQVPSDSTDSMNSSLTRTERFAFWNMIEL